MAVGVVFEEGEMSGLVEDDDNDRSVLEVVVVVVFFLPSPSLLLASFLAVLLDCIGSIRGVGRVLSSSFSLFMIYNRNRSFRSLDRP